MLRRLLRNRHLIPAALMASVCLGGIFGFSSTATATAADQNSATTTAPSGTSNGAASPLPATPQATTLTHKATTPKKPTGPTCAAESKRLSLVTPNRPQTGDLPANSGAPAGSKTLTCTGKEIKSYGNRKVITYTAPTKTSTYLNTGEMLFRQNCSSCHKATASGGDTAPNLRGVGAATVEFWVDTGRMPAKTSLGVQAPIKPPQIPPATAKKIAAWITSLDPAAPFPPSVNLKGANLNTGGTLFSLNCAACHTISGGGDALATGTTAPSLHHVTPDEIAEAMRTGPGNMPRFTGSMNDAQVRDVVAFVSEKIQHPANTGGAALGGLGPVAEGFVALLFGVGGLMLVCYWIGDRT